MGKLIGLLLAVVLAFVAAMALAGDLGGEVVVLTTDDTGGGSFDTKLWVVEDHDQIWLRAGQPNSDWLIRLKETPIVRLRRGGETTTYRAVIVDQQRERINRLMAERYGWADSLIGLVRDENETTAIRLAKAR